MKGISQEFLESERPDHSASHCVNYALKRLFADDAKSLDDEIVKGLTFEELIGALLLARDMTTQTTEP